MWALAMFACKGDQPDLPKMIVGTWEVHQVEVAGGEVDARVAVTNGHPGCVWGRMTLTFEATEPTADAPPVGPTVEGHLSSTTDVLCPTKLSDEMFGCTVTSRVPASWDVQGGKWIVADGATVRNRTRPLDAAAMASGTACESKISPGQYEAVTVRNQKWKWEMRTPDGTVYRLRMPQSERPDFVAALNREQSPVPTSDPAGAEAPAGEN